ncbi:MAG: hypothetical protein K2L23_01050, partial [Odoribacter sp.]|nr:hypothetical protein [Odoribacter sp.]
ASPALFMKRFFDRFNAFQVLKYLNFVHEDKYRKADIQVAVEALFRELHYPWRPCERDNLDFLRSVDRI